MAFAIEALSDSGTHSAVAAKPADTARQRASFRRMTFRRGFIMSARFAPDGSVVYGAAWEDKQLEILSSYQTGPEARPLGLQDADKIGHAGWVLVFGRSCNFSNRRGLAPLPKPRQEVGDAFHGALSAAIVDYRSGNARLDQEKGRRALRRRPLSCDCRLAGRFR